MAAPQSIATARPATQGSFAVMPGERIARSVGP